MNVPPLCIIQARLKSTRIEHKMLQTLGGETLIARAWRIACEAFGDMNCVVAIPFSDREGPLLEELRRVDASVAVAQSAIRDWDVLARFYHVAHSWRWHPESIIVRYTPDDPFKRVDLLRENAQGQRWPVELGGEAFTLKQLDRAHRWVFNRDKREHITHALFGRGSFPAMNGEARSVRITIDTPDDLARARAMVGE